MPSTVLHPGATLPRARPLALAVACVLAGTISDPAAAQITTAQLSDTIHPFVTLGYNHDDNLLRLRENQLTLYGGDGSDNFRTAAAGFLLERPIGRQKLSGSVRVSRVNFDHYSQLDYNGKDGNVDLAWVLGNHLKGHAGALYSQTLTPFNDFHTDRRNLRTQRKLYADAAWNFHPSWRLVGSYTEQRYHYDLFEQRFNNRTEKYKSAGIDYLASSSSSFGVQVRRIEGNYPNQEALLGTRFYNGYVQDEQKLNINWSVTAATRVQFLGGRVERKHEFLPERDDKGTNGRLIADWTARERLKFNAQLWREFTATEGNLINSALGTGQSATGTWDLSSKLSLDANYKHERREFKPFAGLGAGLPSSAFEDSTRTISTSLTYRPRQTIEVVVRAFRDTRTGSLAAGTGSFKANGLSLNASAQF